MRPGPPRGATATLEVTVTPEMTPHTRSGAAPPMCGTAALSWHVERLCRDLLEPHLEHGEEGMGAELELSHRAPVPVGETMTLTATVASVAPSRLVCEVLVRHAGTNVARGSFEQHVLPSAALYDGIEARRTAPS